LVAAVFIWSGRLSGKAAHLERPLTWKRRLSGKAAYLERSLAWQELARKRAKLFLLSVKANFPSVCSSLAEKAELLLS
tara:strand:- start:7278 stop:7511 length:234 start_codon:yes stop_codon:yes gene_type:complete